MKRLNLALIILFVLDRFVKSLVWFSLEPSELIHPVLNQAIAFSLSGPDWLMPFLPLAIAAIIALLLFVTVRQHQKNQKDFFWWGLIVAGAVSNLMDRVSLGGVLDYIDLGWWPVFNVSDSYIFVGVVALIYNEVWAKFQWRA